MANYTRDPPKEVSLPLRLPLIGVPNQRGASTDTDSRLVNGYAEVGQDEVLRVAKRPGLELLYTCAPGYGAGMFDFYEFFYVWTGTEWRADIYLADTSVVTGVETVAGIEAVPPARFFYFNEVATGLGMTTVLFHNQYTIWTYDVDANTLAALPYNGEETLGPLTFSITTDSVTATTAADISTLLKYSAVSGTGIAAGTLVESIDSSTQITLSVAATATNASASLTFELSGPPAQVGTIGVDKLLAGGVEELNTSSYLATRYSGLAGSDPLDPRAWDPLNLIYAYADIGPGVYLAKNLSYLVLLKETATEFFRDVGVSPGSPLERLEGLKLAIGCYSARTVRQIDGSLLWCSTTESGLRSVYIMTNTKADEIATPAIRRLLENTTPKYAISFSICGHSFYVLTSPADGYSLVYDITSKLWYHWNALGETYFPFVAASTFTGGGVRLQHESNGNIYIMDPDFVEDEDGPFAMDIYPPIFDANMRTSKYLERMYVIADQESAGTLKLRVNDDDQAADEWTDYREFDLTHRRPALYDCGSFTKRNFHFRHDSAAPCRLVAVEMDLLPGTL